MLGVGGIIFLEPDGRVCVHLLHGRVGRPGILALKRDKVGILCSLEGLNVLGGFRAGVL